MANIEEKQYEGKMDVRIWKRLFAYAFRHKKVVLSAMIMILFVCGIDIAFPLMTRYAIDNFVVPGSAENILRFGAVYLIMMFVQAFCVYKFIERGGRLEMDISFDIREEGFQKLQELSFSFYDKTPVGYLLARMVSDISRLSEMIAWSFIDLFWSGIYLTGSMVAMLLLNARLALIVMIVIPPLMFAAMYFQKKILKHQRVVRKTNSRITSSFNEGIMGAMTTKTLVREEANFGEFQELTTSMRRSSVKAAVLSATFLSIVISLSGLAIAMILYFGGNMALAKIIQLGTLAAFIAYATSVSEPIQQLARVLAEFQMAQASAERVLTLIDTPNDIVESEAVIAEFGDNFHPKRENWPPIKGNIEFRNVSFSYKGGETVLDNFSVSIKAGETIALVGETGAGKSTIVNLVCRFYEPTAGQILIDGVDYRERSSLWLEESLGYVLQSPHLFSGTIEDNIRYGNKGATREQVEEAAKMVSAHEFISGLTKGYETEVGEGGALLSTGQKQLISFARVILANPRIFVLDEATSSIDTETEQLIQSAITKALSGRTSFLVAHRLSTIRSADRILVIRGGKITEQGSHSELMKLGGYYHDLYTNQFRQEQQNEVLGVSVADEAESFDATDYEDA